MKRICLIDKERYKSLRNHTQRFACLTLYGHFKINDSKGEYAIYDDAVYNSILQYNNSSGFNVVNMIRCEVSHFIKKFTADHFCHGVLFYTDCVVILKEAYHFFGLKKYLIKL